MGSAHLKIAENQPQDEHHGREYTQTGKIIDKALLTNTFNHINFSNGTILVNFRHTRLNSTISCRAKPLPCLGGTIACEWTGPNTSCPQAPFYVFQDILVPAGDIEGPVRLLFARPNPSRSGACVGYEQSADGAVAIDIYDVSGRRVRRVGAGRRELQEHAVAEDVLCWDGEDSSGSRVASGVYLVRLLLDGRPVPGQTRRITVVR